MATRMLVDATHDEETRVVVVKGNRLEEFDFETSTKKQLKGNIYLAKVTRVEPSLQAAFVDYGGNRHGFLAFNEIHPDYYQIPVEDRDRLLEAEQELEQEAMDAAEQAALRRLKRRAAKAWDWVNWGALPEEDAPEMDASTDGDDDIDQDDQSSIAAEIEDSIENAITSDLPDDSDNGDGEGDEDIDAIIQTVEDDQTVDAMGGEGPGDDDNDVDDDLSSDDGFDDGEEDDEGEDDVVLDMARIRERARRRLLAERRYKIQEVIKRRQVLLIQVVKEERGNKGAALTTYLSLAGRYCVLMPNTARGGGISRKIVNATMRRKLKGIANSLDVQEGMGLIIRTAGMNRNKAEIKRDYEYLLRQWDTIREETLHSKAPALINEEASLIKRAIRDLYTREVDEVLVEGEQGYKTAKNFMRMLMPSHARKVHQYKDRIPAFHRYQVEQQLDAMHKPDVELKSGGYIVLAQTEALVAIDVNSGKSTKERSIEETALKTNLEAAEEVARQVRLRDLAGLVVIDFIDMEEPGNNRAVERRLKECLKNDRARIQVGRISSFGLLEMSRQRLRPSLFEASTLVCPHCEGSGFARSTESSALQILRHVEEEGLRDRSSSVTVHCQQEVALYLLNNKRAELHQLEERYGLHIAIQGEDDLYNGQFRMDRVTRPADQPSPLKDLDRPQPVQEEDESEDIREESSDDDEELADDGREPRRRRRRRRRGSENNRDDAETQETDTADDSNEAENRDDNDDEDGEDERGRRRRRRGRRGGRRRRRRGEEDGNDSENMNEEGNDQDGNADSSDGESNQDSASEERNDESENGDREDGSPRRRRRRNQRGRGRNRRRDESAEGEAGDNAGPDKEAATPAQDLRASTLDSMNGGPVSTEVAESLAKPDKRDIPIKTEEAPTPAPVADKPVAAEPAKAEPVKAAPAPVAPTPAPAAPAAAPVKETAKTEEPANKTSKKGWWRRPFG